VTRQLLVAGYAAWTIGMAEVLRMKLKIERETKIEVT
jgi:hypothetical protein